jgi:DNA recombination protein RmuC
MTNETWLGMSAGTWLGIGAGTLLGALAAMLVWRLARARATEADGLILLQQQLDGLRAQLTESLSGQGAFLGQQIAHLTAQVNERLREGGDQMQRSQHTLGERLDNAAKVVGDVQRGLGELREATAKVYEVGRDVASLQDILRAPKLRGGLGEFLLVDLLAQVLPAAHYAIQHEFRSGERVDAVVRLGGGLVPVDAKFPLEDFRRLLQAADDEERARAKRAFSVRLRKHVDDIAGKYIRPDEGTFDFALMYVPAENVYYETIVRDDDGGGERGLTAYALERRVVPVSPNSFYAYLQAIVLGLRGLRIEARTEEVMGQLSRLTADLGRLRDDFRLVGKHLGNAQQAYAAADRRLDRLGTKLSTIAGDDEREEQPAPAQALLLRMPDRV